MKFFDKIIQKIPHPFKYIQRKLDIEKEWAELKSNLRPHKYKLTIGFLVISYPLYSSYLKWTIDYGKYKVGELIRENTSPNQYSFQWTENLYLRLYKV